MTRLTKAQLSAQLVESRRACAVLAAKCTELSDMNEALRTKHEADEAWIAVLNARVEFLDTENAELRRYVEARTSDALGDELARYRRADAKHTPAYWVDDRGGHCLIWDDRPVLRGGRVYCERAARALNAHDDLVVALRDMIERAEETGRTDSSALDEKLVRIARAALAKAGAS